MEALTKSPQRIVALPTLPSGTSDVEKHKEATPTTATTATTPATTEKAMTLDAMRKTSWGCESALKLMSSNTDQLDDTVEPSRKLSREPLITIVEDFSTLIYPEQHETSNPKKSAPAGVKSAPAQSHTIVSDI